MKAQSELLNFILLFIIGIALFTSATIWSKGIFQQNADLNKLEVAEKFMKDLSKDIDNIVRFGGSQEIEYNVDGTIELNTTSNNTIEVKVPIKLSLSQNWTNISTDSFYIQEKTDNDSLRIQLIYPQGNYKVEFFTEGLRLATPKYVDLERVQTPDPSDIKINVTFA